MGTFHPQMVLLHLLMIFYLCSSLISWLLFADSTKAHY
jgi:hypothetical protein